MTPRTSTDLDPTIFTNRERRIRNALVVLSIILVLSGIVAAFVIPPVVFAPLLAAVVLNPVALKAAIGGLTLIGLVLVCGLTYGAAKLGSWISNKQTKNHTHPPGSQNNSNQSLIQMITHNLSDNSSKNPSDNLSRIPSNELSTTSSETDNKKNEEIQKRHASLRQEQVNAIDEAKKQNKPLPIHWRRLNSNDFFTTCTLDELHDHPDCNQFTEANLGMNGLPILIRNGNAITGTFNKIGNNLWIQSWSPPSPSNDSSKPLSSSSTLHLFGGSPSSPTTPQQPTPCQPTTPTLSQSD